MPNVMGREFPYTPQGMAEAEQYRQAVGMRGGGMMGFRPVGYQDGDLVESVGTGIQQGVSDIAGAPVDAVNSAMGAVGLGSTTPVGGSESISNAIDTVKDLVQQFAAQDVPDPVKAAVNAAIETFGMPVDLVNSALGALGFPVSETPIGGSKNLKELIGMRGGGMMGFRPVGYANGDLVEDMPSSQPKMDKATLIEIIMDLTGMEDPSSLLDMSYEQLLLAQQNLMANAPQAARGYSIPQGERFGTTETVGAAGRMALPSSLVATGMGSRVARALEDNRQSEMMNRLGVANRLQDEIESGIPTRGSPTGPDLTGAELLSRLSPEEQELFLAQRRSAPVEMNRGGIMSLREGGLANYGPGGGGVVNQLQELGGRAQEFASSVQNTIGGGGSQLGSLTQLGRPVALSYGGQGTGGTTVPRPSSVANLMQPPLRQQI